MQNWYLKVVITDNCRKEVILACSNKSVQHSERFGFPFILFFWCFFCSRCITNSSAVQPQIPSEDTQLTQTTRRPFRRWKKASLGRAWLLVVNNKFSFFFERVKFLLHFHIYTTLCLGIISCVDREPWWSPLCEVKSISIQIWTTRKIKNNNIKKELNKIRKEKKFEITPRIIPDDPAKDISDIRYVREWW